jgi:hypothetical protein
MSTKSQVLSVSFRTQGRVDVEPPSVADSLRECVMTSPRTWQAVADEDVVDNVEDEVVEVFFFELSAQFRLLAKTVADFFPLIFLQESGLTMSSFVVAPHEIVGLDS